jgi:hypothetical protein
MRLAEQPPLPPMPPAIAVKITAAAIQRADRNGRDIGELLTETTDPDPIMQLSKRRQQS